ncbi:MAG: Hsp20/alpha crystallin family protein [Acidobacteriaceae bacterium]|jgi:HSP20 family protein|nr:Hsp20/alpha crystallin family protein [Acidobacteriaceae bacterium]
MTIVRWSDPFREFAQWQGHINRTMTDTYSRQGEELMTSGHWVPPVDIFQSGDRELVMKAELPDMSREAIDVTVDKGVLTITGEKKRPAEVSEEQFHRIERSYGSFRRSFALPTTVDASKVAAEYKNGVLTVRLPLREESKPRQVKVDIAA